MLESHGDGVELKAHDSDLSGGKSFESAGIPDRPVKGDRDLSDSIY